MTKPRKQKAAIGPKNREKAESVFTVDDADAGQVADEIGALRAALSTVEKKPVAAAAQAPAALRRLLEIIENINLRLADLESEL